MQQFINKLLVGKLEEKVSPPVNEPVSTNIEQATRYQDTLSQLARHSRDAKLLMLYRAMDLAG